MKPIDQKYCTLQEKLIFLFQCIFTLKFPRIEELAITQSNVRISYCIRCGPFHGIQNLTNALLTWKGYITYFRIL